MPALHDSTLVQTFLRDREILKHTTIPMVTVAGTFQEDLKRMHGFANNDTDTDIVLSRAHFSMAYGVARSIWGNEVQPDKAWLVDPTNYVSSRQWKKVEFTEEVGKLLARQPLLKSLKDLIDRFGRNKLPILESITPPLLYLFEDVHQPILSFHIAAGNILAKYGKSVVQVITDPHVREDYLQFAHLKNMVFCVFDESTKLEALEKAEKMNIKLDPERIIVTGPPIDHRIVQARFKKKPPQIRPLRIAITTGGLGTNKKEISTILKQLLPELKKKHTKYEVMVYCGTQHDIYDMVVHQATEARVKHSVIRNNDANLTILYHPQIFDANEMLIKYAFPWADVFISKPSGDMAYDAVASGSALLTLQSWGVWEDHIAEIFRQKDIARTADIHHILDQLTVLTNKHFKGKSWVQLSMENAKKIDKLYLDGTKNIVKARKAMGLGN